MILNALVDYYDRLQQDTEQKVAPFGFSRQNISFEIVLTPKGTLAAFQDAREERDKRTVAKSLIVPGQAKPSGAGINPCFLWDNAQYMLGYKKDDPKPDRTRKAFEAFRDRHLQVEAEVNDEAFSAVCRFLESWDPSDSLGHDILTDITGSFGVFRVQGAHEHTHDRPAVLKYWRSQVGGDGEGPAAPSLISGETQPIARLHEPAIKGVFGAQTSGAKLVGFNLDAFESYKKSQSYNAPVGIEDTFKYCTALNRLTSDREHRLHIAGSTVVFWSERPTVFESEFGGALDDRVAEDDATMDRLRGFFSRMKKAVDGDPVEDAEVPFYVLGLSPNASRLSVRFWLKGTVRQFAERLGRHMQDMEVCGARTDEVPLTLRRVLDQTARDRKDVQPLLEGSVLRAILSGGAYPQVLFNAIMNRIRIEGEITYPRAAILKAYLIRNWRTSMNVYVNKNHPEKAYHCGRLFAILAFAQEKALGRVNASVVQRTFGSVMATPGIMLGRLMRNAQSGHIPKLQGDLPKFIQDELKSTLVLLRDNIPVLLDLREQGVFSLGFYQQLQYLGFIGEMVTRRKRHRTSQGEWVRSKLERRVADTLAKLGLSYIYEISAILPGAGERWPDFFVGGKTSQEDVFIEVLGMDTPEYNERWKHKEEAYTKLGVTEDGGPRGRLIILDFRKTPFDETAVQDALRGLILGDTDNDSEDDRGTSDE